MKCSLVVFVAFAITGSIAACSSHDSPGGEGGGTTGDGEAGGPATSTSSAGGKGGGTTGDGGAGSQGTGGKGPYVPESVVIDFDALPNKVEIADHYMPYAFFSTDATHAFRSYDLTGINLSPISPPNMAAVQLLDNDGDYSVAADLTVEFAAGASNLSFYALGVNSLGVFGQATLKTGDGQTHTIALEGKGDPSVPVYVDLSAYPYIVQLHLHDLSDAYGVGYDSFSFSTVIAPPG